MNQLKILKISNIDNDKLVNFYNKIFVKIKSFKLDYLWKYQTDINNGSIVMLKNDEIVGHIGCYPAKIKLAGKIFEIIWWFDLFVKKEYRKLGIAKALIKYSMNNDSLQAAIVNEKSLGLFKKMGWSQNFSYERIIYFLPFKKFLHKTLLEDKFKSIPLNLDNIKALSKNIDEAQKNEEDCLIRDINWFKWRFLEYPLKDKIIFLNSKNKYILGIKKKWFKMKIFKVLFSNFEFNQQSINMINDWAKKNNFIFVSLLSSNKISQSKILRKKINLISFSTRDQTEKDFFNRIKNIQFSDSDIGF